MSAEKVCCFRKITSIIPFFLNNVRSNRAAHTEAHRDSLDKEQCKQLIVQVFENYILADREKENLLSIIKYGALLIVALSAILVIGWILNYVLAKKPSRNARKPGTIINEDIIYPASSGIPFLLQTLNDCKIEGSRKHKYITEKMVAQQNNDFEVYENCDYVKSDELDLPKVSGDDDVFKSTESTDSESQFSERKDHITCAVEETHMPSPSCNVRVTKM